MKIYPSINELEMISLPGLIISVNSTLHHHLINNTTEALMTMLMMIASDAP